jgi:hypothetical protein
MFHSYVSLPEGTNPKNETRPTNKGMNTTDILIDKLVTVFLWMLVTLAATWRKKTMIFLDHHHDSIEGLL